MMRVQHVGVVAVLAMSVALAQSALAETITVSDPGFEAVALGDKSLLYLSDATAGSWYFAASSAPSWNGILASQAWGAVVKDSQAAFVQGTGEVSQTITGFAGGSYSVSFYIEARYIGSPVSGADGQPLTVTIDGIALTFGGVSTISPTSTTDMMLVTSDVIALAAGSHTLAFTGTIPNSASSDHTDYIDNVSVTSVPEPSSIALVIGAMSGLLAYAWRKRRTI